MAKEKEEATTIKLSSGRIIEDPKLWAEATETANKLKLTKKGEASESAILGEYKKLGGKFHK